MTPGRVLLRRGDYSRVKSDWEGALSLSSEKVNSRSSSQKI